MFVSVFRIFFLGRTLSPKTWHKWVPISEVPSSPPPVYSANSADGGWGWNFPTIWSPGCTFFLSSIPSFANTWSIFLTYIWLNIFSISLFPSLLILVAQMLVADSWNSTYLLPPFPPLTSFFMFSFRVYNEPVMRNMLGAGPRWEVGLPVYTVTFTMSKKYLYQWYHSSLRPSFQPFRTVFSPSSSAQSSILSFHSPAQDPRPPAAA